jgi:hypothetical protein
MKQSITTATVTDRLATLTDRQREVYEAIKDFWDAYGYGPSVRDLVKVTGLKSPNSIMCHLLAIDRKGVITRGNNKARSLNVIREPEAIASDRNRLPDVREADVTWPHEPSPRTKHIRTPVSYKHLDYTDTHCVIRDARGQDLLLLDMSLFHDEDFEVVAYRVAACINACQGVATGALEAGVMRRLIQESKDGGVR